jgi:dTMP kinase
MHREHRTQGDSGMSPQPKGLLIAFEGLDQSGKQTQAEGLRDHMTGLGRECRLLSFPDYSTPIGTEIERGLHGEREYGPDVMQLLYVANRHEKKPEIEQALDAGVTIVCDRYIASSIAYGEAQGLDAPWLAEIQRFLPSPDLCILLDIAPETAAQRKAAGRDKYERDLELLARVRASYHRQAAASDSWLRLDGERSRDLVRADVLRALSTRLAQR